MTNKAYINDVTSFLPNEPISNDDMEKVLGVISPMSSKTRRVILRSNGIKTRHYAIDMNTGKQTHNNAQMTALAVNKLRPYKNFNINDIECLCCGTSTPDLFIPGHASMVHGELKNIPCDVISTSGVCCSGIAAIKHGFANVLAGLSKNAVATGSELASSFFKASQFKGKEQITDKQVEESPILGFNGEFLRWMISDGAGAVYISNEKNKEGLSLEIDFIDLFSFANELPTCMFAGASQLQNGEMKGWREFDTFDGAVKNSCFAIQQDVKLLNKEVVKTAVDRALPLLLKKRELRPEQIDWFLPHYSSEYFRGEFYNRLKDFGFEIPLEKWFTNLTVKGNTGAASIYIILEELFKSSKLKKGQKLLCFIPESGRFSICYMMLTVV